MSYISPTLPEEKKREISFHTSRIELSLSALKKNIKFLQKIIGPRTIFSSVIKGNAYGHNIRTFVPMAEKCGIRHFSVFSAYEGLIAKQSLTQDSHIMVMGDLCASALEWAIENEISFYVFTVGWLEKTVKAAKKVGRPALVHLEVETGMYRTGLNEKELDRAIRIIKSNPEYLIVEGVCTHYAGAESISNYVRVQDQIHRFKETALDLARKGLKIRLWHTACSSAALRYPDTRMDLVRLGIAHYGFWPNKETQMHYFMHNGAPPNKKQIDPLKRVLTWKSRIMNIKDVGKGEFVGYGNSYMTARKQKIASVPIGYFHGFARQLSNRGYVLIQGRRALVVGIVNMNMMMVDVTDFPEVNIGDEVVIIGSQKKQQITVGSFSDMTQFLNYEILVRLPEEIPRVVVP
ncbi:MAG: alanine racemase [candidate division Zixibacteria bacterium]|nr:alanine racemase [candidate division Zixibacteria bacterium]